MKIRKIQPILDAEIYRPGMEDGFEEKYYNKETYGVYADSKSEYCNESIKLPYIITFLGKEIVNEGDVIINPTTKYGKKDVIHKSQFDYGWEIIED